MQVLVATYGSRGDVEPMVALAVALREQGARVRVCAPPDEELAGVVRRARLPLVPFPRSWRSWAVAESTAAERVPSVEAFVEEHIAATYDTLAGALDGCDLLVATGMLHFVTRTAAEAAGVPHRFVAFSPSVLAPQPWHEAARAALDAHRASLGLAPVEDVRTHLFGARPWVAADPVLSGEPEDGLGDVVRTGAWILPDARPLPRALLAFLDAGTAPVHVGFGSMRVGRDSARAAVEAARAHGRRVLLAQGWAGLDAIDDAGDCVVVGEANQQALFERVAAVVHHGGAGTTTAAALTGAPQVVVPQAADQPFWAERVGALGIGAARPGPAPTAEALATALTTALSLDAYERATEVARAIRTDGAAEAARLLVAEAR